MTIKTIYKFLSKDKVHLTTGILFYISLIIIALISFYPLFTSGIGSADDMTSYISTLFGNQFTNAKYLAEMSGRFYYLIVAPFHNVSYIVDNLFVIKLFQIIPICFCLFLFCVWKLKRVKFVRFVFFFYLYLFKAFLI